MVTENNPIKVKGAKMHNLKNIDLEIPRNKLVVITGVSGSGKSSLAFDTLYAEGQRRYVESLSAYARQFLGVMEKPKVEKIQGISPAISIEQRKSSHNPRSTVGTATEIADFLRLLFARIGQAFCPQCGEPLSSQTVDQIGDQITNLEPGTEILILAPLVKKRKGEHQGILEEIHRAGFVRVRIDGVLYRLEEALELSLERNLRHNIEVVVDQLVIEPDLDQIRLIDSLETGLKIGEGVIMVYPVKSGEDQDLIFSEHLACEKCEVSFPEITPRLFSFNSPRGACPECTGLGEKLEPTKELIVPHPELSLAEGAVQPWAKASHRLGRKSYFWRQLRGMAQKHGFSMNIPFEDLNQKDQQIILKGDSEYEGVISNLKRRYHQTESEATRKEIQKYMEVLKCPACEGKRLRPEALNIKIQDLSIDQIVETPIGSLNKIFTEIKRNLEPNQEKIARPILKEIRSRLQFLSEVGLDYLTLDRQAKTLAAGEEQRIRLATQIGSQLTGILYILDEPSIGLHPRDQNRLIKTLHRLRDLNNTVIVVEHDPQTIKAADWVIDLGPKAGKKGGQVVFEGTPSQLLESETLTGQYLAGKKEVKVDLELPSSESQRTLTVKGAQQHNLKNIRVEIPLNKLVCVTGVSGSGKSSLVTETLSRALMKEFYNSKKRPGEHQEILGIEHLDKAVTVDQSPIGRTPRSNPATYTGVFDYIRDLFSETREARARGYEPGRFSFNTKEGRCEACKGHGTKKIEMYFLPEVYVECKECQGKRYNKETLQIQYKGKNIAQVLSMTCEQALDFFQNVPGLSRKLKVLKEVGLGYLELGQPSPSLSGGEAQRIKLAKELSKKSTGNTFYILDEPTTGLHPHDIKKLILVLKKLVAQGNTVLIIEHNLDIISNADWIIDLGPEGGEQGGQIVATGPPSKIAQNKNSYTGKYLKPH